MPEFVHTCGNRRGCQSAHSHYQASEGNPKKLKNNIGHRGYQGVAEEGGEVGGQGHAGLFEAGLGGGSGYQGVQGAAEPTEIEPGEGGADEQANGPGSIAGERDRGGSDRANCKRQPGDAVLGAEGGNG